ncbi:MAG: hypothetical protein J6C96_12580 [Oscillospiraceae bacterium]|nr:hypothetical protein [Oscillospiraceae bacterium]
MSKAVLISIQPKWCGLIFFGTKTIEMRKSRPKIETPFKCYIYCTKAPKGWVRIDKNIRLDTKVIGEFTCDKIACYSYNSDGYGIKEEKELCADSGLTPKELYHYLQGLKPYAWHISDLVIYDNPKELSDFEGLRKTKFGYQPIEIKRPPQSWCYVDELEGKKYDIEELKNYVSQNINQEEEWDGDEK